MYPQDWEEDPNPLSQDEEVGPNRPVTAKFNRSVAVRLVAHVQGRRGLTEVKPY